MKIWQQWRPVIIIIAIAIITKVTVFVTIIIIIISVIYTYIILMPSMAMLNHIYTTCHCITVGFISVAAIAVSTVVATDFPNQNPKLSQLQRRTEFHHLRALYYDFPDRCMNQTAETTNSKVMDTTMEATNQPNPNYAEIIRFMDILLSLLF